MEARSCFHRVLFFRQALRAFLAIKANLFEMKASSRTPVDDASFCGRRAETGSLMACRRRHDVLPVRQLPPALRVVVMSGEAARWKSYGLTTRLAPLAKCLHSVWTIVACRLRILTFAVAHMPESSAWPARCTTSAEAIVVESFFLRYVNDVLPARTPIVSATVL